MVLKKKDDTTNHEMSDFKNKKTNSRQKFLPERLTKAEAEDHKNFIISIKAEKKWNY